MVWRKIIKQELLFFGFKSTQNVRKFSKRVFLMQVQAFGSIIEIGLQDWNVTPERSF